MQRSILQVHTKSDTMEVLIRSRRTSGILNIVISYNKRIRNAVIYRNRVTPHLLLEITSILLVDEY